MNAMTRWPVENVTADQWLALGPRLAAGELVLVAHWAAADCVYAALYEQVSGATAIARLMTPDGRFPALGGFSKPARRLERAIRDRTGVLPEEMPDARPWLDHGRKLEMRDGIPVATAAEPYAFLPVEGEGLHQIPVGPVHAGIIEPGHFRFTCNGETVVRLEARLGYVHKGIEDLMAGAELDTASKLAGRVSGDSTVAYAIAFAQAVEKATGTAIPPRAVFLRAVMAELERLANHAGDIGAVCNDAAFALMLAHGAVLREKVLRACDAAFGHRLMMDCVIPGGAARDLDATARTALMALIDEAEPALAGLNRLYEDTASLQDRTVRSGVVLYAHAKEFGAGGFIGRACGRAFDARRALPYAPYEEFDFDVPVLERGDVDARIRIRFREAEESLKLLRQLLVIFPEGPIAIPVARSDGIGAALVEGFRGDIFAFVRMAAGGCVAECHLRDPSWFQWPLLESAVEGNIVADFPLCNKSFNCSYAGHDL